MGSLKLNKTQIRKIRICHKSKRSYFYQVETIGKAQLSLGRLYFWGINTTHQNGAKFNRTTWLAAKDPNGAKPSMGHRPITMAGTAGPLQLFPATYDVTA